MNEVPCKFPCESPSLSAIFIIVPAAEPNNCRGAARSPSVLRAAAAHLSSHVKVFLSGRWACIVSHHTSRCFCQGGGHELFLITRQGVLSQGWARVASHHSSRCFCHRWARVVSLPVSRYLTFAHKRLSCYRSVADFNNLGKLI